MVLSDHTADIQTKDQARGTILPIRVAMKTAKDVGQISHGNAKAS